MPTLLGLGAAAGVTALAVRIYHRPRETLVDLVRAGVRLTGIREETIDAGGLPMHYYCAGRRGTPIVLIHGLGSSAEVWIALLLLLQKEFLVYAPDMPGFGRTPMAPEGVNIRTHVLYLERFLDALGYPRVSLLGNSLGGWIAARFAIEHPERIERLYLLNSAGLRRENMNVPYALDRESARRAIKHMWGWSLPLPGFALDAMIQNSQMPAYRDFLLNYDPSEELDSVLADIHTPTTIIWGERDRIFPITCANDLHAGIPNSELILLPNAAHITQLQAPLMVARIIMKDAAVGTETRQKQRNSASG